MCCKHGANHWLVTCCCRGRSDSKALQGRVDLGKKMICCCTSRAQKCGYIQHDMYGNVYVIHLEGIVVGRSSDEKSCHQRFMNMIFNMPYCMIQCNRHVSSDASMPHRKKDLPEDWDDVKLLRRLMRTFGAWKIWHSFDEGGWATGDILGTAKDRTWACFRSTVILQQPATDRSGSMIWTIPQNFGWAPTLAAWCELRLCDTASRQSRRSSQKCVAGMDVYPRSVRKHMNGKSEMVN